MMTAKQIEANRRNALLGTGPKTEAGKAVSRLNAIKHGVRAVHLEVLPNEDPVEYQARIDAWFEHYDPTNPVEERLVRHAVNLTWRRDRAGRCETALLSASVGDAMARSKQTRFDRFTHACLSLLPKAREVERSGLDPAGANWLRLEVETTAVGCRWLIGIWQSLRESAQAHQCWTPEQELHAIRLLGHGPDPIYDPNVIDMVVASRLIRDPKFSHSPDNWNDGPLNTEFNRSAIRAAFARKPADPSAAFAVMLATADRAIASLEEVFADRERDGDLGSEDGEMAGMLASFDPSVEGERLRRYQFALDRELVRTLDTLARLRRDAAKQAAIRPNGPISPAPNKPISVDEAVECGTGTRSTSSQSPIPPSKPAPNEAISVDEAAESGTGTRGTASMSPIRPSKPAPNEANWELRKKRIPAHKLLAMARAAKQTQSGR